MSGLASHSAAGTFYIPSLTLPGFVFNHPAVSILLPVALGTLVGFSSQPRETQKYYLALKQPPLRPPGWVFGPVWTALYASMGYAAYRAWTIGTTAFDPQTILRAQEGATLYTIQLGLNLIWMPLFFRFKRPIEATIDVVALLGVTGYLTYVWGSIDEVSGWLLAPYLGWLSFATYLCAGAGWLNGWDFAGKERPMSQKKSDARFVDEKNE